MRTKQSHYTLSHIIQACAIAAAIFLLFSRPAKADGLSERDQGALTQTQELLRDHTQLQKEGLLTPEAKQMDARVQQVTGGSPKATAEVYDITADIFGNITKEAGGNPEKMQELVEKAMANPQAFEASLTPEEKARIEKLVESLTPRQPASAPQR
jgi:hypothetical protein